MNEQTWKRFGPLAVVVVAGLLPLVTTGCQSTVAGQTLPSAYYLRDDVQYFPAGPEFKLSNQVRAIEEFQADQDEADFGGGGGSGGGGGVAGGGDRNSGSGPGSSASRPPIPAPQPSMAQAPPSAPSGPSGPVGPTSSAPSFGTGLAGSGGGATTPMLGRIDVSNRLNIFDNNSAFPQTRPWVAFLSASKQDPGIRLDPGVLASDLTFLNPGTTGDITGQNDVNVFRVGGEIAFGSCTSVSFQGQTVAPFGAEDAADGWTNPQVLVKQVLVHTPDVIWSGVIGANIDIDSDAYVINDSDTRILVGALYYADLTPYFYSQGGANVSASTGDDPHSIDWTTGLGYWCYRHPSIDDNARSMCDGCPQPFIRGITPAIYLMGKHTVGSNGTDSPFGIDLVDDEFAFTLARYAEPRNVVDMTVGTTVHMARGLVFNVGTSFALTGPQARQIEFLSALNWYY